MYFNVFIPVWLFVTWQVLAVIAVYLLTGFWIFSLKDEELHDLSEIGTLYGGVRRSLFGENLNNTLNLWERANEQESQIQQSMGLFGNFIYLIMVAATFVVGLVLPPVAIIFILVNGLSSLWIFKLKNVNSAIEHQKKALEVFRRNLETEINSRKEKSRQDPL